MYSFIHYECYKLKGRGVNRDGFTRTSRVTHGISQPALNRGEEGSESREV